jgi:hypothetical protein
MGVPVTGLVDVIEEDLRLKAPDYVLLRPATAPRCKLPGGRTTKDVARTNKNGDDKEYRLKRDGNPARRAATTEDNRRNSSKPNQREQQQPTTSKPGNKTNGNNDSSKQQTQSVANSATTCGNKTGT